MLLVVGRSANAAASWTEKKTKALLKKDSKFNFFCILQSIEFEKFGVSAIIGTIPPVKRIEFVTIFPMPCTAKKIG